MNKDFKWRLTGHCYKLGHDVPHAGGVVPNSVIAGRYFDAKDIIPHLFEETDPAFHSAAKPGTSLSRGATSAWAPR
jgi:3-isopropylmalate/(R)-2-methylmalate dehydratase small subunit